MFGGLRSFNLALTETRLSVIWKSLSHDSIDHPTLPIPYDGYYKNRGCLKMVAREGIEPPTRGFSMACCKISNYISAG